MESSSSPGFCLLSIPSLYPKYETEEMPNIFAARPSSPSLIFPNASPDTAWGPLEPDSPFVAQIRSTCHPLRTYLAIVPPVASDSSSGWAKTKNNFFMGVLYARMAKKRNLLRMEGFFVLFRRHFC